jgi:hypothetical protein
MRFENLSEEREIEVNMSLIKEALSLFGKEVSIERTTHSGVQAHPFSDSKIKLGALQL